MLESRRVGASRCLSVARDCASVDSTPKKIHNFFWRVWAGFLPLASYLISGTVLKSERQQPEFDLSGFAFNAKSKSVEFFCCLSLLDPRLEARGTASALARGRSAVLSARQSDDDRRTESLGRTGAVVGLLGVLKRHDSRGEGGAEGCPHGSRWRLWRWIVHPYHMAQDLRVP